MNNSQRKWLMLLFIWLSGGFSLLYCAFTINEGFLLLIPILMIVILLFLLRIKCPHCKRPVISKPTSFMGIKSVSYSSWVGKECKFCGYKFD